MLRTILFAWLLFNAAAIIFGARLRSFKDRRNDASSNSRQYHQHLGGAA